MRGYGGRLPAVMTAPLRRPLSRAFHDGGRSVTTALTMFVFPSLQELRPPRSATRNKGLSRPERLDALAASGHQTSPRVSALHNDS